MNWAQIMSERLKGTGINLSDSVVAELAAHLEETYEFNCSLGFTPSQACERTLHEVTDWRALASHLRRATSMEDFMNHRTRTLWLPALATFSRCEPLLDALSVLRNAASPGVGGQRCPFVLLAMAGHAPSFWRCGSLPLPARPRTRISPRGRRTLSGARHAHGDAVDFALEIGDRWPSLPATRQLRP